MEITKDLNGYTISRKDGDTVTLTVNEVNQLVNLFNKDTLRERIQYKVEECAEDWLDLSLYPYSAEEFIDEIYTDLEDNIDYGEPVSDEYIEEHIADVIGFYEANGRC